MNAVINTADAEETAGGIAFESVLEAFPYPVLVVGAGDAVTYVNSAAEQFFGAGANQLMRRCLGDLLPFGSPVLSLVEEAREKMAPMSEYEVEIVAPRLPHRSVNVTASPVVEIDDSILLTLQENTIASTMDRQLTHRGAARSVTAMAAVLAPEVKNPLSGIRGAAQLLEQNADPNDKTLTRLICDETDRIVGIVERMEMFSDKPIEREPVNIHRVLERVRGVAESGFASGIKFSEQYDPSLPPVFGNFDQLVQVFLNLVKNAAEAVDVRSGEIQLSTAFRHGISVALPGTRNRLRLPIEVCVQDNGPGVPEDLLPYLFDPFVTGKAKGTGLGLALVAKLIRDHGGIVECVSTAKGTMFRVMLPMDDGRVE